MLQPALLAAIFCQPYFACSTASVAFVGGIFGEGKEPVTPISLAVGAVAWLGKTLRGPGLLTARPVDVAPVLVLLVSCELSICFRLIRLSGLLMVNISGGYLRVNLVAVGVVRLSGLS